MLMSSFIRVNIFYFLTFSAKCIINEGEEVEIEIDIDIEVETFLIAWKEMISESYFEVALFLFI